MYHASTKQHAAYQLLRLYTNSIDETVLDTEFSIFAHWTDVFSTGNVCKQRCYERKDDTVEAKNGLTLNLPYVRILADQFQIVNQTCQTFSISSKRNLRTANANGPPT